MINPLISFKKDNTLIPFTYLYSVIRLSTKNSPGNIRVRIEMWQMSDLGYLRGIGGQMRGLGMGYFRCIHDSPVMGKRGRRSVIPGADVIVNVTSVRGISAVMRRSGCLSCVCRQMRLLGVRHFRCVDHSTVGGQGGRGAVIMSGLHPVCLIRCIRGQG